MDALSQDFRYALRTLRRDRVFTAITILTLALGIGANTAVFSVVQSVLLEPLPYKDPDRLAMVWTAIPSEGVHEAPSAYANIRDWKTQNRVFEDLATFDGTSLTLTGGEWPEQISTAKVSANFFSVLGVTPIVGRTFSLEEERQRAPVVVLSRDLWQRRFGASPDAIGQTVEINGSPFQVIGIMPHGFWDGDTQVWLPQTWFSDWDDVVTQRGAGAWRVLGRLHAGVSFQDAQTDLNVIASRLERMHPSANAGLRINLVGLHDQVTGHSFQLALWTLFGAVGLVLLIACGNAAHLILARGIARAREHAVRVALGATRPRLIRQALAENIVVSLAAGITGMLFGLTGLRLLLVLAPDNMPRLDEIGINTTVLIFATAVSLAAGVLFGIAPSLSYPRDGSYNVLREGRSTPHRTGGDRARRLLIAFQFALALILVFGANLLIRSLIEAQGVHPGFQRENVFMANLRVESSPDRVIFYDQVIQSVRTIPGVRAVGIVEDLFVSGAPTRAITIEGRASAEPRSELRGDAIGGELFETIGAQLRDGRGFSESDGVDAAPVAIINETMARRFWPGETPIGKRFRTGGPQSGAPWIEVVGVVEDMHRQGLENAPIPQVFRPFTQQPSEIRSMNLLVRTAAPVPGLATAIRTRIAEIDPMVPLYGITTVSREMDRSLLQRRFQTVLLGLFSVIALILAAVGVYGLVQYSVSQRTREIGVRVALGAHSRNVVSMILRQGLMLALPGLAVGIICALWLSDAVSALLFGVAPTDLANIVVTSGILLLTTVAACYIPARRAARVDPLTALRNE